MSLFDNVKGQDRAIKIVTSHIKSDLLSHAYIFVGREGSGKEFFARQFSKYILCGAKKDDDCKSCTIYEAGVHPDFFLVDGTERIKIEQIREAIERLNLTPSISRKKVLLVTHAENMGTEAANAILKTLEEPPRGSIILITVSSEKTLPETVISRSQIIKLKNLNRKDIQKILSGSYEAAEAQKIATLSGGSIGKSLELLKNKNLLEKQKELYDDANFLMSQNKIADKFRIIDKYDKGKEIKNIVKAMSELAHLALSEELSSLSSAEKKSFLLFSKKILKTYPNLEYNINLRIVLEEIMLEDVMDA